ncbi:MAG: hypothetical protein Q7J10_00780 [Methanosarcinaceae archaeon]|nr:hypothetical protein [Methanosarcinaceae archaeon]
MNSIERGRKLDFTVEDVNEVYEGPAGILWEMLMGEQIHVGGEAETDALAQKAGVSVSLSLNKSATILDICSALGGPARHLARKYGSRVTASWTFWFFSCFSSNATIGRPFKKKTKSIS